MLTAKQHQTYQFIRQYISQHDYAPTEAEIASGIGIKSRGVVHRYVTAIADAGYITIIPNRRRNIRLINDDDNQASNTSLPIVGTIAAGHPIEAIEHYRNFDVVEKLLGNNRFILEVRGDSMIGDNICDGDYIICEKTEVARNNTIVVALIDKEEATLKRFHNNNDGTITLLPSNPRLSPLVYTADRVQIQGTYQGLLRMSA